MKKRILILLVMLFSLLTIACGKSEKLAEESSEALNQMEAEAEAKREKYNAYVGLYNELGNSNPIIEFDREYIQLFSDDKGNYRKAAEKSHIESFSVHTVPDFTKYDEVLENTKKYINTKPEYEFDKSVEEIIKLSDEAKNKIIEIVDYYAKALYLEDNYARGEEYHNEYNQVLNELSSYVTIFINEMEKLKTKVYLEQVEKFEKEGALAQLNIQKFNMGMNDFLDMLYNKENLKFTAEEIASLKEIKNILETAQKQLEDLSDEQLKDENIPKDKFRNTFLKNTKDLIDNSSNIIASVEKKQDKDELEKRIDEYAELYSRVIQAYNSMLE